MKYSPPVTRSMSRSLCSECSGTVPWTEQNPHAHPANGRICSTCGHFYGAPAYGGTGGANFTLLMRHCARSDWDSALRRLAYVPQEADYVGTHSKTALQEAILKRAPVDVVRSLANAYPGAASIGPATLWNPLPTSFLVYSFRRQENQHDERRHYFTEAFFQVCKILLEADSRALQTVLLSLTPGNSLWLTVANHISVMLDAAANRPENETMEEVLAYEEDGIVEQGQVDLSFRLISLFVKADRQMSLTDDVNVRLVHAISGCPDQTLCIHRLFLLAVRFYPEQLTQPDGNGDCPLHIAAAAAIPSDTPRFDWYNFGVQHVFLDNKEVIETLLKSQPDSAAFRDRNGKLPIHRALAHSKTWAGGVKALVEAYPGALNSRDPDNMLYPFMLAAMGNASDLDTSFELLRGNPQVLADSLDRDVFLNQQQEHS